MSACTNYQLLTLLEQLFGHAQRYPLILSKCLNTAELVRYSSLIWNRFIVFELRGFPWIVQNINRQFAPLPLAHSLVQ